MTQSGKSGSGVRDDIEHWVFDSSTGLKPGGLLPTTEAIDEAVRILGTVWDVRPKPRISSIFDGDLQFEWRSGDRGAFLSVNKYGVPSCVNYTDTPNGRQMAHMSSVSSDTMSRVLDWVLASNRPSAPAVDQVVSPTTERPQAPPSLDDIVDRVIPWGVRTVIRGARFVKRQASRIDPALVSQARRSVGRVRSAINRGIEEFRRNGDA